MSKSKTPLTPEQVEINKMKKEKAASGFTSFLAVVLAVAIAMGVLVIGKSTAQKQLEQTGSDFVIADDAPGTDNDGFVSNDGVADDVVDGAVGTDEAFDVGIGMLHGNFQGLLQGDLGKATLLHYLPGRLLQYRMDIRTEFCRVDGDFLPFLGP